MRILLLEDNDSDADVITRFLERGGKRGIEIERVVTLQRAMLTLMDNADDFDIVLLDYYLPGTIGNEAYEWLSKYHPNIIQVSSDPQSPEILPKQDLKLILETIKGLKLDE